MIDDATEVDPTVSSAEAVDGQTNVESAGSTGEGQTCRFESVMGLSISQSRAIMNEAAIRSLGHKVALFKPSRQETTPLPSL
jgi:hypothetical protein